MNQDTNNGVGRPRGRTKFPSAVSLTQPQINWMRQQSNASDLIGKIIDALMALDKLTPENFNAVQQKTMLDTLKEKISFTRALSPEKDGDYVFCYDKKNQKSFRTNVSQVCFEVGFYEDAKKPKKPIEDSFSLFERECSKVFGKVIDAQDLHVLDTKEFADFVVFMLLFKQRTQKRRQIVSFARKLWLDKMNSQLINNQITDWKVVSSADNPEQSDHLWSIVETYKEEIAVMLKNDWQLVVNKTKIPFWTSDDPLRQSIVRNDKRFKGPYIKNYFPLTSSLVVHSQPLIGDWVSVSKAFVTDESAVSFVNRLTWDNAQRYVISKEETSI